jgi:hypothetical protein
MRISACLVVMFLSCGDGRPDAPSPEFPHAPTDAQDPPPVVVEVSTPDAAPHTGGCCAGELPPPPEPHGPDRPSYRNR